jgi:hypothetical protein
MDTTALSDKGTILHDEIFQTLKRDNVDPFARPYRDNYDKTIDMAQKIKPYWPTNRMGYWRDFASNRKYLEDKSARNLKKLEQQPTLKKKVSIKQFPKSLSYKSSTPSFSFSSPPKSVQYLDYDIIGGINKMSDLMFDQTGEVPVIIEDVTVSPFRPGDIGEKVKGGSFTLAKPRPPLLTSITACCNLPTVEELEGGKRIGKAAPFSQSVRNTVKSKRSLGDRVLDSANPKSTKDNKGKFMQEDKFVPFPDSSLSNPNVGRYQVFVMLTYYLLFKPCLLID